MARKIPISQLSSAVMEQLTEYAELATEDMKEAVKKAGMTVRKDIEASAPRDTGDYAKSWAVKTTKESANALQVTVHSRNRYQIAHLLEHGHAKRGGRPGCSKAPTSPLRKRLVLNSWSVRLRGA